MRKWNFFKWTRDNQKAFADEVAAELDNKATREDIGEKVSKTGDSMTGPLVIQLPPTTDVMAKCLTLKGQYREDGPVYSWDIGPCTIGPIFYINYKYSHLVGIAESLGLFSEKDDFTLGYKQRPWAKTFTKIISNGDEEIAVPSKGGTLALVSDIEDILRKHGLIPTEQTEQTKGEENAG